MTLTDEEINLILCVCECDNYQYTPSIVRAMESGVWSKQTAFLADCMVGRAMADCKHEEHHALQNISIKLYNFRNEHLQHPLWNTSK